MSVEEALKAVKGGLEVYMDDYPELTYPIELHEIVIRALEKQVPDKIGLTGMDYWKYACPNCGAFFTADVKKYRHCSICGQTIDWSE